MQQSVTAIKALRPASCMYHYGNGAPPEVFSGMLKQGKLC